MEQHKTNESVKSALQVETNSKPVNDQAVQQNEDAAKETDADELVHQQQDDSTIVNTEEEQDPDELVHSIPAAKTVTGNNETDPDDLVHQQ